MLSESYSMPGLFLILPYSPSREDGMVFLPNEPASRNGTHRKKTPELSTSPALQNQTTSRYKLTSERVLEDNDC